MGVVLLLRQLFLFFNFIFFYRNVVSVIMYRSRSLILMACFTKTRKYCFMRSFKWMLFAVFINFARSFPVIPNLFISVAIVRNVSKRPCCIAAIIALSCSALSDLVSSSCFISSTEMVPAATILSRGIAWDCIANCA